MERSEPSSEDAQPKGEVGGVFDSVGEDLVRDRLAAKMFGREAAPRSFGRFELRAPVGRGGMGTVYAAWDPVLEREVALKVVDTSAFGPAMAERALREARSLAKLAHPNVVSVFDAGQVEARVWIAMELLAGRTLGEWLEREPKPSVEEILRQWVAVGRGLAAVHGAGLVHRDVKPGNIVVGEDERPRLIDFGLVRDPGQAPGGAKASTVAEGSDSQPSRGSQTEGFVGTLAYAAPEQLAGGVVDARADQYSLCVGIWEALCGQRPRGPETSDIPQVPAGVKLPATVQRALLRGLAVDPGERYPGLEPLLAELESAMRRRTRRLAYVVGTAAASVLATSMALAGREVAPPDPCPVDASALAGTWDDARRGALRERLADHHLEFVERTTAQLESELDAWAQRWQDARHSVCAATRIEGVQSEAALDLRSACLERKRRSVDALLDTMVDPALEIDVAAHAPELLRELPRLEACDDPQRLAEVEPLPPQGPKRDAILAAYDAVTRARTLANIGDFEGAEQQLGELTAQAERLGYVPLALEVEALPGQLDLRRDREARAIAPLVAIARRAAAARLDELAATLFVESAEGAAGAWSKPELERWLVDEAAAALERLGHDEDAREISLGAARGKLLVDEGKLERALEEHRGALELALALEDRLAIDRQRNRIASALGDLGHFDEARAEYDAVCTDSRARWGPNAPLLAKCEFNLGALAIRTGELEQAAAHFDRAEAIYVASFGIDSYRTADVRFAQAKLAMFRGELEPALATIDAIIEVYERELGADHGRLAEVHEGRGVLRYYVGDLEGSISSYESALAIQQRLLGPEHSDLAELYSNLGESQLALGRLDEALRSFDLSLSIYGRSLPDDHPDLALPLKGRGQAMLRLERPQQALPELERALTLVADTGGEPLELADVRFTLARALRLARPEAASRDRARALAQEARAVYVELGLAQQVAAIDEWSAER